MGKKKNSMKAVNFYVSRKPAKQNISFFIEKLSSACNEIKFWMEINMAQVPAPIFNEFRLI